MLKKRNSTYCFYRHLPQNLNVLVFEESVSNCVSIMAIAKRHSRISNLEIFHDLKNCYQHISLTKADIVILDVQFKGKLRFAQLRLLKAQFPFVHFLILSAIESDHVVFEALHIGVSGYVIKSQLERDLSTSIDEILNGGIALSARISRKIINTLRNGSRV